MEMVAEQIKEKADLNKTTVIKASPHHMVNQGNINQNAGTQDTANTQGTDTQGTNFNSIKFQYLLTKHNLL